MSYGVCRTLHRLGPRQVVYAAWWAGDIWTMAPLYTGPFATREEAEAFVKTMTNLLPLEYHVYEDGEPFGGEHIPPARPAPTRGQLIECGALLAGDTDARP